MPLLALVAVFIVLPLAELYVILEVVGPWLDWYGTVALLVADSILGSLLLRAQGRAVWRRFNTVLAEGRVPHREVLDGVLIVFGGAFLITPGFITDVLGLILLIPPTRAVVRRILARRLGRRVMVGVTDRGRSQQHWDADGTATEQDAASGRLDR
jgi:UPF0716 protein FxsA